MIFQIKAAFSCLRDSYEPFGFRVDLEFNAIEPAVNQTLRSWNQYGAGSIMNINNLLTKVNPANRRRTGEKCPVAFPQRPPIKIRKMFLKINPQAALKCFQII